MHSGPAGNSRHFHNHSPMPKVVKIWGEISHRKDPGLINENFWALVKEDTILGPETETSQMLSTRKPQDENPSFWSIYLLF